MADSDSATTYTPMTPTEAAAELGVPLTQRLLPDLSAAVPKRFVTLDEAKARKWSWYWDGTIGACRYGHQAARRTTNENICSDCERVKDGKEPIYGKSRTQKYYTEPRRKPTDPTAPIVIAAPAAQPAQIEPSKKEQDFLAALDSTRSFEAAAEQTGFNRGLIEARASSNEVFRKALDDLCERRQIPRTLKTPEVESFQWTPAIEAQLVNRFIDTGLLQTAREELAISASSYFVHLERSPNFAAAIEAARPRARETLRDRAIQAADRGQDKLLKILEEDAPETIATMSPTQLDAELRRLLTRFDAMGLIQHEFQHRTTGQRIDLREFEPVQPDTSNLDLVQP